MQIPKPISLNQDKTNVFDWITFLITFTLIIIGLASIYSATFDYNKSIFFNKQLISALIGLAVMFSIMFMPQRIIKDYAYFVYGIAILLLLTVLLKGNTINGTRGWLKLGFFTLQPSEVAKLGTILALAKYVSKKGVDIRTIRDFSICIALAMLPILFIFFQPDFGSATVILVITFGFLFWTGYNSLVLFFVSALPFIVLSSLKSRIYFLVLTAIFSIIAIFFRKKLISKIAVILLFIGIGFGSPIIYEHLQEHQQARIETFLNPGSDPQGDGYNVWQSMLAVGSGGFNGKGYKQGTLTQLRYIPEQWTDFIYSVPAEEFGFIGAAIVIFLQFNLINRAKNLAFTSDDKFFSVVIFGFATLLFYHCVINIGMVVGLMPVMGIPLPFMSYGGSSIITNLSMVGIMLNVFRNEKLLRSEVTFGNY